MACDFGLWAWENSIQTKDTVFFFRFQIMLIHWIFKFDFQSLKVELFHFDLIQIELDSIAKNNSLMHIACMFLFHTRIMHVNQENLLQFF